MSIGTMEPVRGWTGDRYRFREQAATAAGVTGINTGHASRAQAGHGPDTGRHVVTHGPVSPVRRLEAPPLHRTCWNRPRKREHLGGSSRQAGGVAGGSGPPTSTQPRCGLLETKSWRLVAHDAGEVYTSRRLILEHEAVAVQRHERSRKRGDPAQRVGGRLSRRIRQRREAVDLTTSPVFTSRFFAEPDPAPGVAAIPRSPPPLARPGRSAGERPPDSSVRPVVFAVRADELPHDVNVPRPLLLAQPKRRAVLAGKVDRPDILTSELVQSQRRAHHRWLKSAAGEIGNEL